MTDDDLDDHELDDEASSRNLHYSREFSRRMLRYQAGPDGYHALVGEYLTTWLEFEQAMNFLLAGWFAPANDADELVGLIAAVPLPRRLKELRRISEKTAISHAKELNDALRAAYETRNRMAHQPVTLDASDPFRVYNAKLQPIEQEELHADLMRLVSAAETIVGRIGDAVGREGRLEDKVAD
jgi:hypothetical protein